MRRRRLIVRARRARSRNSRRIGADESRSSRSPTHSGCHCTPNTYAASPSAEPDGLDDAVVGRARLDDEIVAHVLHRLVVDAVDRRVAHSGVELGHAGPFDQLDRVPVVVVGLPVAVDEIGVDLGA